MHSRITGQVAPQQASQYFERVVSGLAAYAMKRCSRKHKSNDCYTLRKNGGAGEIRTPDTWFRKLQSTSSVRARKDRLFRLNSWGSRTLFKVQTASLPTQCSKNV